MYAAPFDYVAASSWEEAVRLLQEGGDEAKVIAGGQSLVPMMTLRLATPRVVVDVTGAGRPEIIREDGRLVISALTRHADLENSAEVHEGCPILAEAASFIGNARVRNRGTIGGSLAHADPAAELSCVALAVEATVRTLGGEGERTIAAADLFDTYFTTTLGPAEVITSVEVPAGDDRTGWAFVELLRRAGDFAVVEVAALLELDEAGRCSRARVAAGGVADRPVELTAAQEVLLGEVPDDRVAAEAGRRAAEAVEPPASVHASAGYRRDMLAVFVQRAVMTAARRAAA
jgi:CO/xanthine dehydrogenase FAD-binding subunit